MELSYTSIIPYFVIMAFIVGLGAVLVKIIPFYRKIAKAESAERYESLDGLRGFLAIGVFFQHAIQNHSFFQTGIWQITDDRFYRFLGGEAVILFFITTSFLYWTKLIANNGGADMFRLYRSRLLRLAPLYIFAGFLVGIIALYNTGFKILSAGGLLRDIFYWFTLGLETIKSFNGFEVAPINAGIHWTLHYEWVFYLILPLIALLHRNKYGKIASILVLIGVLLLPDRGYWAIFLFGIMAAYIVHYHPAIPWFKKYSWLGVVPILGLVAVYLIQYKPYSYSQYAVSLIVFLCFVYGNDLFGLLKMPVAKFLSTLSYSIYLLHGIVLYFVLRAMNAFYPITSLSPLEYWTVILFAGLLVVAISSISYRFIEHPFVQRIKSKKKDTMPVPVIDKVM
ncbi:MAG TPA: acyltransferase [Candidatus Paceibacterota bacterium]